MDEEEARYPVLVWIGFRGKSRLCDIIQHVFEPSALEQRVDQRRRDVKALAAALIFHNRIKERGATRRLEFVPPVPREFLSAAAQVCAVCDALEQECQAHADQPVVPDFCVPVQRTLKPVTWSGPQSAIH
jgi:hypothetical protein